MAIALAVAMIVPMAIRVDATVARRMVERAVTEAVGIWRDAGVDLEWCPSIPGEIQVEFGDARGRAEGARVPLAWIGFRDGEPDRTIYVSRANAFDLLGASGGLSELPVAAVNEWLGRALGRALAHEIGHYLLRSAAHDSRGLMATNRTTGELFGLGWRSFLLTPDERERLASVLQGNRVAQRAAPPFE